MFTDEVSYKLDNAAMCGKRPSSSDYQPVKPGDTVIGVISSDRVLALMASYDSKLASAMKRWPVPPTDVSEMAASIEAGMEIDFMRHWVRFEIRHLFGMAPTDRVIVRRGFIVVKEGAAPPVGIEVAAGKAVAVVKAVGATNRAYDHVQECLRALYDGAACGNEACHAHGTIARLARVEEALATMTDAESTLFRLTGARS